MTDVDTYVPKPQIWGYEAVRKAARNSRKYSSDLRGDTDIRTYRHLPLEADPPRHGQLRLTIAPIFAMENIAPKQPVFERIARDLIAAVNERGHGDVVHDIAIPFVQSCLAAIYNRPQDREEWISWGPSVWSAGAWLAGEHVTEETKRAERERNYSVASSQRSAKTVDDYLTRVLDHAEAHPRRFEEGGDIWDYVAALQVDGVPLTREEKMGMASVIMAGGRDTVIKLVTGIVWRLVDAPDDRVFLSENPDERLDAIHEWARYLSPLAKLERLRPDAPDDAPENRVLLNFASANHDPAVFPHPDRIDIHRVPVQNVAFGFGRHSCLGVHVTETETQGFLEAILNPWPNWEFADEPPLAFHHEGAAEGEADKAFWILDAFESDQVRVAP